MKTVVGKKNQHRLQRNENRFSFKIRSTKKIKNTGIEKSLF
jgi:hypothetical protein